MADSVNIPLIVDADDAFGAMLSAYRTTRDLIRAGAAGMFISDRAPFILATEPHSWLRYFQERILWQNARSCEVRNKEDKDFIWLHE